VGEGALTSAELHSMAIIACGALAREVLALKEKYKWQADVFGVPALLHNHPDRIPPAVQRRIRETRSKYARVVVVFGDCGTGGMLDQMLEAEGVERVTGPHCYEMYAGDRFETLVEEATGTFFLTDFLVRSFDHLVIQGLGLDRHPELLKDYFGNYVRAVYLAQTNDARLEEKAQWAADQIRLPLEVRRVGLGALESRLQELVR
jgi:hypothetical protein